MFIYAMSTIQITAIAVIIIAVLILVGLFVYNHVAGVQVETLKSIDSKLDRKESAVEEKAPETVQEATVTSQDKAKEKEPEKQPDLPEIANMYYSKGKSGKVYSKEELEMQIKE